MSRFIEGDSRSQAALLPEALDDYIAEENPVRVVDVFVDHIDLYNMGFKTLPADTGRPAYSSVRKNCREQFLTSALFADGPEGAVYRDVGCNLSRRAMVFYQKQQTALEVVFLFISSAIRYRFWYRIMQRI